MKNVNLKVILKKLVKNETKNQSSCCKLRFPVTTTDYIQQ